MEKYQDAAALVADLAQLPAASMATLKALVLAADRGDREAAATLTAVHRLAVDNPQTPPEQPMSHEQRLEAHFSAKLAEAEAADRARLAGRQ